MASDPPPHGDPVDLEGSTAMATILPPVTADSAETVAEIAEALPATPSAQAPAAASLEAMRQQAQHYAEQNVETARGQVARNQKAVALATTSFDDSYRQASEALIEFNQKMADSMRANIESTVAFWTSMMATRSLSEAVALNAQHIRKQMEALTAQGRELSSIAQRLATQSFEPLRTSLHSTVDQQ